MGTLFLFGTDTPISRRRCCLRRHRETMRGLVPVSSLDGDYGPAVCPYRLHRYRCTPVYTRTGMYRVPHAPPARCVATLTSLHAAPPPAKLTARCPPPLPGRPSAAICMRCRQHLSREVPGLAVLPLLLAWSLALGNRRSGFPCAASAWPSLPDPVLCGVGTHPVRF